jgi:chromosome segregation ATPase
MSKKIILTETEKEIFWNGIQEIYRDQREAVINLFNEINIDIEEVGEGWVKNFFDDGYYIEELDEWFEYLEKLEYKKSKKIMDKLQGQKEELGMANHWLEYWKNKQKNKEEMEKREEEIKEKIKEWEKRENKAEKKIKKLENKLNKILIEEEDFDL